MGWQVVVVALVVVLLCMLPLVSLYMRRRWLTGQGGVFDCAYRREEGAPGSGWTLGLARYRGETLEWFRAFSFGLRPSLTFRRGVIVYNAQRPSNSVEAVVLFDESRVVTLRDRITCHEYSLAMSPESVMALMSWFEAAPPGSHYLPSGNETPL